MAGVLPPPAGVLLQPPWLADLVRLQVLPQLLPMMDPVRQQLHPQLFQILKLVVYLHGGQVRLPWPQVKGMVN